MDSTGKHIAGIRFDPDVLSHLAELSRRTDRSRNWLVNTIIREHARELQEKHKNQKVALEQPTMTIHI